MRLLVRTICLLVLSVALVFPMVSPLRAQVETQRGPQDPSLVDPELTMPPQVPLVSPTGVDDKPDPRVKMDGNVRLESSRFSDVEWRYRIENGSDEVVTSVYLAVPDRLYDSRVVPYVPWGWTERREPGEGKWKGLWFLSYFANRPEARLKPGKWMEIAVYSGAQLLVGKSQGKIGFGTSPFARLVYPWDEAYYPFKAPIVEGRRKPVLNSVDVPYPSLSFLPLPSRDITVQQGLEDETINMLAVGQGVHSGTAFQMTLRSISHMAVSLPRGSVMVPSLEQYDVFIVGRSERVIMAPHDAATIAVRGYSISYGRRAPPPRVVLHDLTYRFAPSVPKHALDTYRDILARATRLIPSLDTALGDAYYDTVVQWALWRAQRLMEGNPLSVRDVERDLAQTFTWRVTAKGSVRIYLAPLQVYQLAKRVWSDTDLLMYEQPPKVIP